MTIISERLETNDMVSKTSSCYYLEKISRLWHREGDTHRNWLTPWSEDMNCRDWRPNAVRVLREKHQTGESSRDRKPRSAESCSVLLKYLTSTNQYICKELLSLGERSTQKDWRRKINQSKINPVKQMLELANKGINTFIMTLFPMF